MTKNMSDTDRIVRSVLAAGAVTLIATEKVKDSTAYALGGLATIFALTSSVGHCPVYSAVGISTN
jgi:hypothetical protein